MALYDGKGIRITFFLKGCPLNCLWCHNPEGKSPHIQVLRYEKRCNHCGKCELPCTHSECQPYSVCLKRCPEHLIKLYGKRYTVQELCSYIDGMRDFLRYGGITFSGGEPLMQVPFLNELLDNIPNISTGIETSAYCKTEDFLPIMKRIDEPFIDLKHICSQVHKQLTGVDNKLILHNIKSFDQCGKPYVIRIPLIPSLNDDNDNLEGTADFLKGLKNLERVELLGYNKLAKAKYDMIGQDYDPPFDEQAEINMNKGIFERNDIKCEVRQFK